MTLIAKLHFQGNLILIGDLLATSIDADEHDFPVPGTPNINHVLEKVGAQFRACMLVQKINILSEQLVVAVAGDGGQITSFLEKLQGIAEHPDLSVELIDNIVKSMDSAELNKLQAIGIIAKQDPQDQNGTFVTGFYINSPVHYGEEFGDVCVGGSGGDSFVKFLGQMRGAFSGKVEGHKNDQAQSVGLTLAGVLAGSDTQYGENLLERWGGGFEVVTYNGETGVFCKTGDIIHLFFDSDVVDIASVSVRMRPYVSKVFYIDGLYFNRIVEFCVGENGKATFKRNELMCVTPVLYDKENPHIDIGSVKADFSCNYICCHTSVKFRGDVYQLFHIQHDSCGIEDFVFNIAGDNTIRMSIAKRLIEDVTRNIINCCRENDGN